WMIQQTGIQEGKVAPTYSFLEWKGSKLALTSLKVNEDNQHVMARWFNMADMQETLEVNIPNQATAIYKSNILEEKKENLGKDTCSVQTPVKHHEIITLGFDSNK